MMSVCKAAGILALLLSLQLLSGCVLNVTASSDDGHSPQNTIDNDLSAESRWSADGEGQWIQYQLFPSQVVGGLDIAFFKGNERRAKFEVWLGNSADSLVRVFQGESSGSSLDFERFAFSAREASYVRIVGLGNNINTWNSFTEVKILGDIGGDSGNDTGDNDATPVFEQNFESLSVGSHWLDMSLATVENNCGTQSSRCLRVRYEPYSRGSRRVVKGVSLPAAKEYTLQYDVRFDADFEFVKGGKMHGLAPVNKTTGCDPIEADGWSARVMWRSGGQAEIYAYHQDREKNCGDDLDASYYFQKGVYQSISLYVKVNSAANIADGEVALYINGMEQAYWRNLKLRSVISQATEINQFLFSTFHGGSDTSWSPSKAVYASYDNFAVVPGLSVREAPDDGSDEWQQANLTWYTSYPDPGSEECVVYNGCTWAGYFAFVDGKQSENWVANHNIVAVHEKDASKYALKTLRLRQGGRSIDVTVYDMCADSDCNGCCSHNATQNGLDFLIDIESYSRDRFGSGSGVVEWKCLDCD